MTCKTVIMTFHTDSVYSILKGESVLEFSAELEEVVVSRLQKKKMSRLLTKPTKWHVRPAKTRISLGIRPV